jgi:outer membrane protein assembly factor BamB
MLFKFAQMTDTHLYAPSSTEDRAVRNTFMRSAIAECAAHGVDFIVNTGDFCTANDAGHGLREFRRICDEAAVEHGIRYHYVRGNHDCEVSDTEYHEIFGPETWWFAHKGWAFIGIDRYHKCYEHTQHAYCMSAETVDKIAAFIEEIPAEMPVVAMLHDDPVGISRFHRGIEMLRVLRRRNLRLLLFGHVQSSYVGEFEGIPFVTVTGEDRPHDCSPLSYNIITCRDGGDVACRFHPYRVNLPPAVPAPLPPLSRSAEVHVEENWLSLRGPYESRCCETTLPATLPTLAWTQRLPGRVGPGGLTLKDGVVFVGTTTRGDFAECGVHALEACTGEIIWSTRTDAGVEGGVCLADDAGFAATTAGSLYRLNPHDGQVMWQWNNRDNMPIACQPVWADGIVHCGANWEMYAVDSATGNTIWRKIATPDGFTYMGPGNASPLIVGSRVYHQRPFNATTRGQGLIQSVRARDGGDLRISREAPIMHPMYRQASPVRWDDKVVAVGQGVLAIQGDQLAAPILELPHDSPSSATPAVSASGMAFVAYHREIVAYDLAYLGNVRWRVPQEPALMHFSGNYQSKWGTGQTPLGAFSALLLAGDTLVVCDCGGHVRGLCAVDGRELWRIKLGVPILGAPVASGNALFVADYEGTVYAFAW